MDFDKIKDYAHSFFNITSRIGTRYYLLKKEVGKNENLQEILELLTKAEEQFDNVLVENGLKYRK